MDIRVYLVRIKQQFPAEERRCDAGGDLDHVRQRGA